MLLFKKCKVFEILMNFNIFHKNGCNFQIECNNCNKLCILILFSSYIYFEVFDAQLIII